MRFDPDELMACEIFNAVHNNRNFSLTKYLADYINGNGLSPLDKEEIDYQKYESPTCCAFCGKTLKSHGYGFIGYNGTGKEFHVTRSQNGRYSPAVSASWIVPHVECQYPHCKVVRNWFGVPASSHCIDEDNHHAVYYSSPPEPYLSRRKRACARNKRLRMIRFSDPWPDTLDILLAEALRQCAAESSDNKERK